MYYWQATSLGRLLQQRPRLAHALLLQAPEGTGVAEFGLWLAQSLLCETPREDGQACGQCAACNWFVRGNHPDFRLVQPDSQVPVEEGAEPSKERKSDQIRIDQLRALQDFLSVGTHRAGARVILLHPADSMNPPAQNALLKNLEEPGPHTFFLLATSQPHRLLPTVRSRCQIVPLPRPDAGAAITWLKEQGVDDPQGMLALAGGAPLLAAGMAIERRFIEQFADRLADPRMDPVAAAASAQSAAPAEVVCELYRWCYDLLLSRLAGRVRYHVGREEAIARAAAGCDPVRLAAYVRTLCEARSLSEHPLNAQLFTEDLLLDYSRAIAPAGRES